MREMMSYNDSIGYHARYRLVHSTRTDRNNRPTSSAARSLVTLVSVTTILRIDWLQRNYRTVSAVTYMHVFSQLLYIQKASENVKTQSVPPITTPKRFFIYDFRGGSGHRL